MTDDRRRAAGSAPPSEPDPGDTLPYAATMAPPRVQGSQPPRDAHSHSRSHGPAHPPHAVLELSRGTGTAATELSLGSLPPASLPAGSLPPASLPAGSRPPREAELPYAPTVTPQLSGSTVDMIPPSRRG